MENKSYFRNFYDMLVKDNDLRFKDVAKTAGLITVLGIIPLATIAIGVPYVTSKLIEPKKIEQKTQNEIVIDSAKVDTTNYQNTINYFDYNKK